MLKTDLMKKTICLAILAISAISCSSVFNVVEKEHTLSSGLVLKVIHQSEPTVIYTNNSRSMMTADPGYKWIQIYARVINETEVERTVDLSNLYLLDEKNRLKVPPFRVGKFGFQSDRRMNSDANITLKKKDKELRNIIFQFPLGSEVRRFEFEGKVYEMEFKDEIEDSDS